MPRRRKGPKVDTFSEHSRGSVGQEGLTAPAGANGVAAGSPETCVASMRMHGLTRQTQHSKREITVSGTLEGVLVWMDWLDERAVSCS